MGNEGSRWSPAICVLLIVVLLSGVAAVVYWHAFSDSTTVRLLGINDSWWILGPNAYFMDHCIHEHRFSRSAYCRN